MKKVRLLIPFSMTLLIGMGIIVGCDKNQEVSSVEQTVTSIQQQEGIVTEEEFENVAEAVCAALDENHYAQVTQVEGGYIFQVREGNLEPQERTYCSYAYAGNTFLNCLKHATAIAPNHCVRVGYSTTTHLYTVYDC
ncbi:hypothetical protein F0P96_06775 [Hymenobacter busanensis]|uniref:Uncharacterized protein n=1 Tax=Hymenobacter busanensis TaxID=2607656 RepID=A0A7L5A0H9_9BACT|nr:hypothetical protein [Hymenobacter busanensis]KAA9338531.1 hypothetical protein F0P96_06775 [Hymenobacter busanensis]QHJ09041.1 hypothetical protein GUY19_17825 [Hymenobacter busanensis]